MSDGDTTTTAFDDGGISYDNNPRNEEDTTIHKTGGGSSNCDIAAAMTDFRNGSAHVSVVDGHVNEDKGRSGGEEEGEDETEGSAARLPSDSKASTTSIEPSKAAAVVSSSTSTIKTDSKGTKDDDAATRIISRPISSNDSRPSVLHDQSPASSYLTELPRGSNFEHSRRQQHQQHQISTRAVDTHVLDDVQDLKWKLYGKNIYFSIVFDAVIKIQAFVRGCLCRGKVADQIDELIQHLVKRREERVQQEKIWEQYRQQDLQDREQRRLRGNNNDGDKEEDNRRVTENVYKPWKKNKQSPYSQEEVEELSPFEELLFARNKTILKREEEEEQQEGTEPGGHMTRKFAVINSHSSTVGTEHSTVEIVDIEMSLKQRLKLWTSSSSINHHNIKHNNNNNKRDDDEKKSGLEQGKDETTTFSGEQHDDHLEGDGGIDDESIHIIGTGSSTCDDSSSSNTDRHQNTSETASSFSASGNQSVTSSIDTELRNNVKLNRQHDLINGSVEDRSANTKMGIVPRRKKLWNTDVRRSESQGCNRKATQENYENYEEGISLDPITMLPTFIEDEAVEKTVPVPYLEPGEKGYSRYRSGTKGRNKQRPWRDDTNVFDAY